MEKLWSEYEKEKLTRNYSSRTMKELLVMFPHRTSSGIGKMAHVLNLKKEKRNAKYCKRKENGRNMPQMVLVVKSFNVKKRKAVETKPVRLDHKTVIYVPASFTKEQIEKTLLKYKKH